MELNIDELAELADLTRRTIRYYTENGLLPPPRPRGLYGDEHFERLEAIRDLQAQGMSLRDIRERVISYSAETAPVQVKEHGAALTAAPNHESVTKTRIDADMREGMKVSISRDIDGLRRTFAENARARVPAVARATSVQLLLLMLFTGVAVAALVVAVLALRSDRGQAASTQYALPDACAAFTTYSDNLGRLAGNLLGPDPGQQLTHDQVEQLLHTVDEALTLREKACVRE